jgi:hypothetical protein
VSSVQLRGPKPEHHSHLSVLVRINFATVTLTQSSRGDQRVFLSCGSKRRISPAVRIDATHSQARANSSRQSECRERANHVSIESVFGALSNSIEPQLPAHQKRSSRHFAIEEHQGQNAKSVSQPAHNRTEGSKQANHFLATKTDTRGVSP